MHTWVTCWWYQSCPCTLPHSALWRWSWKVKADWRLSINAIGIVDTLVTLRMRMYIVQNLPLDPLSDISHAISWARTSISGSVLARGEWEEIIIHTIQHNKTRTRYLPNHDPYFLSTELRPHIMVTSSTHIAGHTRQKRHANSPWCHDRRASRMNAIYV